MSTQHTKNPLIQEMNKKIFKVISQTVNVFKASHRYVWDRAEQLRKQPSIGRLCKCEHADFEILLLIPREYKGIQSFCWNPLKTAASLWLDVEDKRIAYLSAKTITEARRRWKQLISANDGVSPARLYLCCLRSIEFSHIKKKRLVKLKLVTLFGFHNSLC